MEDSQSATLDLKPWIQANDAGSPGDEEVGDALSVRVTRFLRSCWSRRRMVAGILACGILLSLLYAFSLSNTYTSTTTLMPPDNASSTSSLMSLLSAAGPAASVGSAALGMKTPGAVFVGILGSRRVQDRLVTRFDLVHRYKTRFIEDTCKQLAANTNIQENVKSGIITISVKADDPVLAAKIAQGYVEELDSAVTYNSTSAARRERIFLEARLKTIKQDLDDSAKALSQFSAKNRSFDIPSQGKAMVESELKLEDQMVAARSELAALRQSYAEDNVRIRGAQARIAELQRQLDKLMGSTGEPRHDADDAAYPSFSELPVLGLTYFDLERKMRVEEVLWEALTKQYEAARVQEAKDIPTVRVLDAANVPQRKSSPHRSSIVIAGMLLSLAVALIAVATTSVWGEMDGRDERKMFVVELAGAMKGGFGRFWSLPGVSWVHARTTRSQGDAGNSSQIPHQD
jgi:uncharacterized protein involved in exopolysaccharide biosynthesis